MRREPVDERSSDIPRYVSIVGDFKGNSISVTTTPEEIACIEQRTVISSGVPDQRFPLRLHHGRFQRNMDSKPDVG